MGKLKNRINGECREKHGEANQSLEWCSLRACRLVWHASTNKVLGFPGHVGDDLYKAVLDVALWEEFHVAPVIGLHRNQNLWCNSRHES